MAVHVTVKRGTAATTELIDTYSEADTVFVKDGHLHVAVGGNGRHSDEHVAVYAPGHFQHAEVVSS